MSNVYYLIEPRLDYEGQPDFPVQVSADELTPPSHNTMFNFLCYDLSVLDKAMKEFIDIFDIETLEIDKKDKEKKLQKVYDILAEIHPYYSFGGSAYYETNKATILYLNCLLHSNAYTDKQLLPKEKYLEVLGGLSSHEFKFYDAEYLDEVYQSYANFNPDNMDYDSNTDGYTFQSIVEAKKTTQMMLFWIFDFSVPDLAHLTVYQRAHLYDSIFNGAFSPFLEIKKNINFGASARASNMGILDLGGEDEMIDIYNLHKNNYSFDSENNIPFPAVINSLMNDIQKITASPVRELCEIDNLGQLLNFEIVNMINQNIIVKRCKYCGNYFIADNLKNEYCNGYAKNEKRPCSEIGATRAYQNKVKKDEVYMLYQRAYKTHFARIKKGKMTQTAFNTWAIEAKQKMADVREDRMIMEEYLAWLKI